MQRVAGRQPCATGASALVQPCSEHPERAVGKGDPLPAFSFAVPALRLVVPFVLAALLFVGAQPRPVAAQSEAAAVLDFTHAQLGRPYEYGAIGLARYDCSGLVFRAFREAGLVDRIGNNRKSARGYFQWFRDRGLVTTNPLPGDLVAWGSPVSHIGIYIGTGSGGNHRAISALVNPWGVSDHRVDGINVPFRAFLRVDLERDGAPPPPPDEPSVAAMTAPSSDTTINLRKGNHRLFELNGSGGVVRERQISLGSRMIVDVDPDIVGGADGRPYAELLSGTWDGWSRRVPDAAPSCCLHRFAVTRTLRLEAGEHLVKSFHANNRVVVRRHVTFDQRTRFSVDYRATFNGSRHFLLADGPHAGYWVVKSNRSKLEPLP